MAEILQAFLLMSAHDDEDLMESIPQRLLALGSGSGHFSRKQIYIPFSLRDVESQDGLSTPITHLLAELKSVGFSSNHLIEREVKFVLKCPEGVLTDTSLHLGSEDVSILSDLGQVSLLVLVDLPARVQQQNKSFHDLEKDVFGNITKYSNERFSFGINVAGLHMDRGKVEDALAQQASRFFEGGRLSRRGNRIDESVAVFDLKDGNLDSGKNLQIGELFAKKLSGIRSIAQTYKVVVSLAVFCESDVTAFWQPIRIDHLTFASIAKAKCDLTICFYPPFIFDRDGKLTNIVS